MGRNREQPAKLYVAIAKQIRMWIESGELRPGDKLPPLARLAEQFQCSRATVREALGALRGQGLVEFRHGDGTYIRSASLDMWMEPLDAALLLAASDVQQVVELASSLFAGVARVAAARSSEASAARLAQALFQLECAEPQGEDAVLAEVTFLVTLAECTGNALMENVVRVLQEALRSCLRLVQAERATACTWCRDLYDAVRAGDTASAQTLAYAYWSDLSERIQQVRNGTPNVKLGLERERI